MDSTIESLNINLAVFVSQLRIFSKHNGIPITQKTLDMLSEAIYLIDHIIVNGALEESDEANDVDFLFNLRADHFKIRPYVVCRLCSELVLANKSDFDQHTQKIEHRRGGILELLKQNKPKSVESCPIEQQGIKLNNNYAVEKPPNGTSPANSFISDFLFKQSSTKSLGSSAPLAPSLILSTRNLPPAFPDDTTMSVPHVGSERPPIANQSPFVVRLGTIPWTTTKKQLIEYFKGVNIVNGIDGIHFIVRDEMGKPNNAFMMLASKDEFEQIQVYKTESVSIQGSNQYGLFLDGRLIQFAAQSEYSKLIDDPGYPANQRVLLITNLPENCTFKEIHEHFRDIPIEHVDRQNDGNPTFITFKSAEDIELALLRSTNKFNGKWIKMYRSSLGQLELFRASAGNLTRQSSKADQSEASSIKNQSLQRGQKGNHVSQENKSTDNKTTSRWLTQQKTRISTSLSSLNTIGQDTHPVVSPTIPIPKDINCVVARGLPWRITKAEVVSFFEGVNVLGGENGILLCRRMARGALEARVNVASAKDHDTALQHKGRPLDGRKIDVHSHQRYPVKKNRVS